MEEAVKVSVIMPVYNAQKHLRECLDSACAQTLREIEILCVDDGSTDESPAILEEYRQRDPRIRVFRQENRGAALARNAGFDRARGEYLICWDADDFFEADALEKLYARSRADGADVCVYDVWVYYEDTGEEVPGSGYLKKSLIPQELPFNIRTNEEHILDFTNSFLWNKMFRRAFLEEQKLWFLPLTTCEDANLTAKALCLADRITVVNERLYHYRLAQSGSLSARWYEQYEDPIRAWSEAAEFLRSRDRLPERSFANRALGFLLSILARTQTSWPVFKAAVELMKNGELEKMGVVEREEGYYYEPWKAECLHHLLQDGPEDFLCFFLYITDKQLRQARIAARELRQTQKKQLKKLEKLEKAYDALLNSKEYKLGSSMLRVPKGIKHKLQG